MSPSQLFLFHVGCEKDQSLDKMGCGMSTEDKQGRARNEEIETQLKRDKMNQRNEIKMLLLGKVALGVSRL